MDSEWLWFARSLCQIGFYNVSMIIITNPQGYRAWILITRERRGGIHSEVQYATQVRIMQPSTLRMLTVVLERSAPKKYMFLKCGTFTCGTFWTLRIRAGNMEKLFLTLNGINMNLVVKCMGLFKNTETSQV